MLGLQLHHASVHDHRQDSGVYAFAVTRIPVIYEQKHVNNIHLTCMGGDTGVQTTSSIWECQIQWMASI